MNSLIRQIAIVLLLGLNAGCTTLEGPANPDDPTNCESIVMFAPQENIAIDTACEIVKNELMEIGINLKYSKKIEWDLNKSFVPPTTGLTKEGGI